MRIRLIIISLIFCNLYSFGQSTLSQTVKDSLWAIWIDENAKDTSRLIAINQFTWEGYLRNNPDSAFYFAQFQYNYADEKGILKYKGYAANTQGASLLIRSRYQESLEKYNEGYNILLKIDDKKGLASAMLGLGTAYKELGDFISAINYYTESLTINEVINNKVGIGAALNNIGIIYKNLGDYQKATIYYLQSLKIKEALGDKKGIAATLGNLGMIYKFQGDYLKAMDCYTKCLAIEMETKNKIGMAGTLNSMGNLYKDLGDVEKGLEHFNNALMLYKEQENKHGIAVVLNNIGTIYHNQGRHNEALQYYEESLNITKEIGDQRGYAQALNNIAGFYRSTKNYAQAIDYFLNSLTIKNEINDLPGSIHSLIGLAECYVKLDSINRAINYCEQTLTIALDLGEINIMKDAYRILFNCYLKLGNNNKALYYLEKLKICVQLNLEKNYFSMTETEKEFYFATMEKDFGLYYSFSIAQQSNSKNLNSTVYNLALANKGLSLKSSTAMRKAILNSGNKLLIDQYENWLILKQNLAKTNSSDFNSGGKNEETVLIQDKIDSLEKKLIQESNIFSDLEKTKKLDWQQVQVELQKNEAAIEFITYSNQVGADELTVYCATLVKKESAYPEIIKLCTDKDLITILGNFQGNNLNFVSSVYGFSEQNNLSLYTAIWEPLEIYLKGIKTIYYSPTGLLHKISFAAINKSQNIVLSDLYNFRQMSSTGNLALNKPVQLNEHEELLLVGGVNYTTDITEKEIWSYLPGTQIETAAINAFLSKTFSINYLKENGATEAIFKEKIVSATIVHVATHGFFFPNPDQVKSSMKAKEENEIELKFRATTDYANWSFVNNKNPLMRSGIVLTGANDIWSRDPYSEGEDGILTAAEVSNLDLRNTKLVVLSACETGLGDIKGSEGVYGLQRAFKMAGVKYIIMSLWQVPDKETSEFMILFYKNLIKLKDIPLAFQKTQKVMRAKYDPYYWAAFVLIE